MNDKVTYSESNPRVFIFYWIFGLCFLVLLCALAYRQIYLFEAYSKEAERQTLRRVIKPGARGDIYDRHGRLLVGNRPIFSAVVYPDRIKGELFEERVRLRRAITAAGVRPKMAQVRAQALHNVYTRYINRINAYLKSDYGMNFEDFKRKYGQSTMMPVPLVNNLTQREHAILSERISVNSAIVISTDTARYYPYNDLAAQALGWVHSRKEEFDSDMPGDGLMTYAFMGKRAAEGGVESAFESVLAGQFGVKIWMVDHDSNRYDDIYSTNPKKGTDIYTSLDIDIQAAAEEALRGRKGAVVALDVKSGEALAIASGPAYDLNLSSPLFLKKDYDEVREKGALLSRATQGLYPPGSTFKLVTAIAGLETGAVTLESMSHCTGKFRVGNRDFPCNSRYGHGWVNLSDAIAKSCNVFFYEHALKMGANPIAEEARAFGLDSSTGIEIGDGAKYSIIASPEFKKARRNSEGVWTGGDTANMSIGQGYMQQTPIQMACFIASLARGETRTKASIIHDPTRNTDMYYHGAQKMKLGNTHYGAIIRGMEEAVISGTCRRAAVDGVRIAAKSGTAQVPADGKRLDLAWMVAFAPVENPKIAIAVVIEGEEPNDVGGGKTAGPAVHKVLKKYFELENAPER